MSHKVMSGLRIVALCATAVIGVSACGASAGGSPGNSASGGKAGGVKIGLVLASTPVSRWKFDEQGFKDEAIKLGDTPVIVDSASTADAQTTAVDGMITQMVKALVIAPADVTTAASLFNLAKGAGIPTVDYNFLVPNYAPNYIVERDAVQFGEITAQQALKVQPTGNYVLVGGDPANSVATDTTQGYLDVLQPQVKAGKITIVSQDYNSGWSAELAQAQVEEALVKTNNNVAAVLSNNDGMAVGVEAALKNAGALGKTFVSGVDADLPNLQAIAEGQQAMTIWTDFTEMGNWAAQLADAAARHQTPKVPTLSSRLNGSVKVPTVVMPTIVVDQSNLLSWLKQYHWATCAQVYMYVANPPTC
jgi:D-xylose transport system substrate-binding protein